MTGPQPWTCEGRGRPSFRTEMSDLLTYSTAAEQWWGGGRSKPTRRGGGECVELWIGRLGRRIMGNGKALRALASRLALQRGTSECV